MAIERNLLIVYIFGLRLPFEPPDAENSLERSGWVRVTSGINLIGTLNLSLAIYGTFDWGCNIWESLISNFQILSLYFHLIVS
jgi:hypothetical protein